MINYRKKLAIFFACCLFIIVNNTAWAQDFEKDQMTNARILALPGAIERTCNAVDKSFEINFRESHPEKNDPLLEKNHEEEAIFIFETLFGYSRDKLYNTYQLTKRAMYSLRKLCVDKVYDNGYEVLEGFPLFKNTKNCKSKVELDYSIFRSIRALLSAQIIRGVEIGCAKIDRMQLRDINFDFLVLKNVEIEYLAIQNSSIEAIDIHNSDIGAVNFQGVNSSKRLIIGRSEVDKLTIFASNLNDIQIYDFYPDTIDKKNPKSNFNIIKSIHIFNSNIDNIRISGTTTDYFEINYCNIGNIYLFAEIAYLAKISETIIKNSLVMEYENSFSPYWGNSAYLDLSGTRVRSFYASEHSFFKENSDHLIPVNFSGFVFKQAGKVIPSKRISNINSRDSFINIDPKDLSAWLKSNKNFFKDKFGVNTDNQLIYQIADLVETNGNADRANNLRVEAKSIEWKDRSAFVWLLGSLTGFGYEKSNLLILLNFIWIGWAVKIYFSAFVKKAFFGESLSFVLARALEDLVFSIDRFFSPLIIQKEWDKYADMSEGMKLYFYVHRIAGSLAIILGVFSFANAF